VIDFVPTKDSLVFVNGHKMDFFGATGGFMDVFGMLCLFPVI